MLVVSVSNNYTTIKTVYSLARSSGTLSELLGAGDVFDALNIAHNLSTSLLTR